MTPGVHDSNFEVYSLPSWVGTASLICVVNILKNGNGEILSMIPSFGYSGDVTVMNGSLIRGQWVRSRYVGT